MQQFSSIEVYRISIEIFIHQLKLLIKFEEKNYSLHFIKTLNHHGIEKRLKFLMVWLKLKLYLKCLNVSSPSAFSAVTHFNHG